MKGRPAAKPPQGYDEVGSVDNDGKKYEEVGAVLRWSRSWSLEGVKFLIKASSITDTCDERTIKNLDGRASNKQNIPKIIMHKKYKLKYLNALGKFTTNTPFS